MDITEKLETLLGYAPYLPPEDPTHPWQRCECPFCGGSRAQVNYFIGLFRCWRCMDKPIVAAFTEDEALVIERYRRQITRAVKRVKYAFGQWVDEDDLEAHALWLVYNYYSGKDPHNDGGMLVEWEEEYEEEPWRLDARVQCVLDRDLLNFAESEKTWKQKTHAVGDLLDEIDLPIDVAVATPNLDGPFDLGPLRRCELQRNGLGPYPGHCKWCNKAIADEIIPPHKRKLASYPIYREDLELVA